LRGDGLKKASVGREAVFTINSKQVNVTAIHDDEIVTSSRPGVDFIKVGRMAQSASKSGRKCNKLGVRRK
jgi:hypothetical protein